MIGTWAKIKQSKGFYVRTYRLALKLMMVSLFLNALLIAAVALAYIKRPSVHFYATNGSIALMAIRPLELTPMDSPNYSDKALLPPDPPDQGTGITSVEAA